MTKDGDDANAAHLDRFLLVLGIFVGFTIIVLAGIVHWNFLPPNSRYFWPASADDWAAWGSWASAFGAIGAVYFAAQSIKHTIEAQKGTERELKADRQHDREEREKERDLVREEREALTKEADRIALNDAKKLTFTYGWGPPLDDQYLEVQHKRHQEEQAQHDRWLTAEEDHDDQQLMFAHVVIDNYSTELVFTELCLWLAEDGPKVKKVDVAEREMPPPVAHPSNSLDGTPPKWTWRSDYQPVFPEGMNQWSLGSIKAHRQLMVKLTFSEKQSYMDWSSGNLWRDESSLPTRHLVLGYRDEAGRHWFRSTRTTRNLPQRLLETSAITTETPNH